MAAPVLVIGAAEPVGPGVAPEPLVDADAVADRATAPGTHFSMMDEHAQTTAGLLEQLLARLSATAPLSPAHEAA
jgi:hypothetical protein